MSRARETSESGSSYTSYTVVSLENYEGCASRNTGGA